MTTVGRNIKEVRERIGLSQADLAEKVGVKQQRISSWESGDRKPKYPMLSKMSRIFNCHPDELDPLYKGQNKHCGN